MDWEEKNNDVDWKEDSFQPYDSDDTDSLRVVEDQDAYQQPLVIDTKTELFYHMKEVFRILKQDNDAAMMMGKKKSKRGKGKKKSKKATKSKAKNMRK